MNDCLRGTSIIIFFSEENHIVKNNDVDRCAISLDGLLIKFRQK